jgi:hypothetical protein
MAHQILNITAHQNAAGWALYKSDLEGQRELIKRVEDEPLGLTPLREDTIELLVDLQHLLADILAKRADEELPMEISERIDKALTRTVTVIGQQLYDVLFCSKQLREGMENALRGLPAEDLLRVELELGGAASKLLAWPWEYICTTSEMDRETPVEFLALRTQLVLTRWLSFEVSPSWTFTTADPEVLLVVAAPGRGDLGPVRADTLVQEMHSLDNEKRIKLLQLIEPQPLQLQEGYAPTASFNDFEKRVRTEQPDIIHFIGHGRLNSGKGQLAFVGKDGAPEWIDDARFAQAASNSKDLKLVFLQACESALPDPHSPFSGVARELAIRKIPAIVAMQAKIENEAANTFACAFYRALADGDPVDWAVRKGRDAIHDILERRRALAFGVPVLYLRSYKRLIGDKQAPLPDGISRSGEAVDACPRCGERVRRPDQKFCTQCGLGFWCPNPKCEHPRLDNPLGKMCGECQSLLPDPPPWGAEDRIQEAPPVAVGMVPGMPVARGDVVKIR